MYASKQVLLHNQVAFLSILTMSFGCISSLGNYTHHSPSSNVSLAAYLY